MLAPGSLALMLGGILSAAAGVAHLACIIGGAPVYRFMGAGEKMARAAEAKRFQPTALTLGIAGMLFVWAAYAFSGAGAIGPLPLVEFALPAISGVYLLRAIAFPILMPAFPENTRTFWFVSSGICLFIGSLHAYGTLLRWPAL